MSFVAWYEMQYKEAWTETHELTAHFEDEYQAWCFDHEYVPHWR